MLDPGGLLPHRNPRSAARGAASSSAASRARRVLVRVVMCGGLLMAALGWYDGDALPAPSVLREELRAEPVQTPVADPPFRTMVDGVEYDIRPRYAYDIAGLAVSLHRSDSFWDTAHEEWDDHINVMDLCVVWGRNATSGVYRDVHFSNSQFTCDMSTRSSAVWAAFDITKVSNNHLLADRPGLARELKRIHVGDQVRLRGYLVDYSVVHGGVAARPRVSSETRDDTGNGACEIIYVTSVEPLARSGALARWAFRAGLLVFVLGFVAWFRLPIVAAGADS